MSKESLRSVRFIKRATKRTIKRVNWCDCPVPLPCLLIWAHDQLADTKELETQQCPALQTVRGCRLNLNRVNSMIRDGEYPDVGRMAGVPDATLLKISGMDSGDIGDNR